ncbi:MAG: hypothetical protein ACE5JI_12015 [Acidobacteriota bacterium]
MENPNLGQKWIEKTTKQLSDWRNVPIKEPKWSLEGEDYTIHVVSTRSGKRERESFTRAQLEKCGNQELRFQIERRLIGMFQRLEAAEAGSRFRDKT